MVSYKNLANREAKMREIKFRAWDKKAKEMIYEALEIKDIGLGEGSVLVDARTQGGNELIWLQYTGLKDKNGGEIYEGDVVEIEFIIYPESKKEEIKGKYISQIIYQDGCFVFFDGYDYHVPCQPCFRTRIIGNIYENPELLDKKED